MMNRRSFRTITAGLILLFVLAFSKVWAGVDSVEEHYYPSVVRLEKTATGLRAFLDRKFMKKGELGFPIDRPILEYSPPEGWKVDRPHACGKDRDFTCLPKKQEGESGIPAITLSREEAIALRPSLQQEEQIEQHVYAWTNYEGLVWFGIGFYDGEGVSGVGGIGRYNPKTQRIEIRRPELLRKFSVSHIAHDGETLWLGTVGYYEGSGSYGHGLVRYDWKSDRLSTFEGTDDGPCGFMVHDLLLDEHALWVATDLGLSRWDRKSRSWDHYVPDPENSPPMRTVTCPELYTSLLKILPRSFQPRFDGIPYSELFQSIQRFRPGFLNSYVRAFSPADWGCDELKFLAESMQDFQTLKAELLAHRPVGSPDFKCLLEGFGGKNIPHPGWRDLLLSSFEKPGEKTEYRDEVVLRLLQGFPGDSKVGEALVQRLKTASNPWREAELLPVMLGEKSVPSLIEAFDRFQKREHILHSIVKALVQATQVSISPNGVITPTPPNADPEKYWVSDKALPQVIVQWKKWWEAHKAEYGEGPTRPEFPKPEKRAMGTAKAIEPKLTLSLASTSLNIGTDCAVTAKVHNIAEPGNPPLSKFSLTLRVTQGPHAQVVKEQRGATDAQGTFTFSYRGSRVGRDTVVVSHEGDEIFTDDAAARVTWGGPDLAVPFFSPPVLRSAGGRTMFVTDWTMNSGSFPSTGSTTRYFLSATNPPDPAKSRIIGERAVPALAMGEYSKVNQVTFTLPSDLPAGIYYLAACADADRTVLESDEQNNCSFSKLHGQTVIIAPMVPLAK